MSIGNLLRDPSIDSLLGLSTLDALVLAGFAVVFVATIVVVLIYATREPVYISSRLTQPFWRKRIAHRLGALSLLAIILVTLL